MPTSTQGSDDGAIVARHWFNPNLIYLWFTVPSLIGTLGLLIALVVTACRSRASASSAPSTSSWFRR